MIRLSQTLPLIPIALLVTGCSALAGWLGDGTPSGWLVPGEVVTLRGEVVGTVDDCAFDGICALIIATAEGEVQVNWSEGDMMNGCPGQFTGNVALGDTVEVDGVVVDPSTVSICTDASHRIDRVP